MLFRTKYFNNAEKILQPTNEWKELIQVLKSLPLYVKKSDQKGIEGRLNFDPVATNNYVKDQLVPLNWESPLKLPIEHKAWGKHVDFGKNGMMLEIQFSNYPFLANNLLRSDYFYREKITLSITGKPKALMIITKDSIFPSANSSLYCKQAEDQLSNSVFKIPLVMISLYMEFGESDTILTEYSSNRYSREIKNQKNIKCNIQNHRITEIS